VSSQPSRLVRARRTTRVSRCALLVCGEMSLELLRSCCVAIMQVYERHAHSSYFSRACAREDGCRVRIEPRACE